LISEAKKRLKRRTKLSEKSKRDCRSCATAND
jgi:hypothetical protein